MSKGKRIKELREKYELTQDQLAQKLETTKQTIFKYENGIVTNIPSDKVEKMASIFNVSPSYILGWDDTIAEKPNRIKVYGSVPAGIPIEAVEDVCDWEDVPMDWVATGDKFIGLKVKGNSMYPKYIDGDTVIVKLQPDCESGQDAVVYVNGYDATLKKVIKQQDGIMLQPINSDYEPKKYDYNDEIFPVSILGVVVELRRKMI